MKIEVLKCKVHRATVTDSDLNYEGSISMDPILIEKAGLHAFEKVDILNCDNGERFTTYVILGGPGEICLNGPAARKVHRGDKVIILSFAQIENSEAKAFKPTLVFVDEKNQIKEITSK